MPRINIRDFVVLLTLPAGFTLHALNEYFGLIPASVIIEYLLLYFLVTIVVFALCNLLFRSANKSLVFTFFLLVVYFGFGALKDFFEGSRLLYFLNPYSRLLPLLAILILVVAIWLRRTNKELKSFRVFIFIFLIASLSWETVVYAINNIKDQKQINDLGDPYNKEIRNAVPVAGDNSPDVYWLIFDEYASSSSMNNVWNYNNPVDSILRRKGFYVADSAVSNYSYTLFSLVSTMDMTLLKTIKNRSKGSPRDMAKSIYSMKETNVVKLFETLGYEIVNYSLWNFEDHATKNDDYFSYVRPLFLKVKTLDGRIQQDIGWQIRKLYTGGQKVADSIVRLKNLTSVDNITDRLIHNTKKEISNSLNTSEKRFAIFHFSLPHKPYMYDSTGNILYDQGMIDSEENYLKNLAYTNKVIDELTDSLVSISRKKNIVVIIQGDHGFKFKESDPEFETESCKILYAIYSSNGDYKGWYNSLSSVNGFRILFNKYFQTSFPLLPDSSYNILFRKE